MAPKKNKLPASSVSDAQTSKTGDVTHAVRALQRHDEPRDPQAEQAIVNHFWKRVIGLARRKLELHGRLRRTVSESDVAQDALQSLFQAIENRNYQDLNDSKGLWNLLATITSNKVRDRLRHQRVLERRGADVGGDSALPMDSKGARHKWAEVAIESSADPADEVASAEVCAQALAALCEQLFPMLTPTERETAALVAEYGMEETAQRLGRSKRMIQIRMKTIRSKLRETGESDATE